MGKHIYIIILFGVLLLFCVIYMIGCGCSSSSEYYNKFEDPSLIQGFVDEEEVVASEYTGKVPGTYYKEYIPSEYQDTSYDTGYYPEVADYKVRESVYEQPGFYEADYEYEQPGFYEADYKVGYYPEGDYEYEEPESEGDYVEITDYVETTYYDYENGVPVENPNSKRKRKHFGNRHRGMSNKVSEQLNYADQWLMSTTGITNPPQQSENDGVNQYPNTQAANYNDFTGFDAPADAAYSAPPGSQEYFSADKSPSYYYPEQITAYQCKGGFCQGLGQGFDIRVIDIFGNNPYNAGKAVLQNVNIVDNDYYFVVSTGQELKQLWEDTVDKQSQIISLTNTTNVTGSYNSGSLTTGLTSVKGSADVMYGNDFSRSITATSAGYKLYLPVCEIKLRQNDYLDLLDPRVIQDFEKLPNTALGFSPDYNPLWQKYHDFFTKWGTHILMELVYGVKIEILQSMVNAVESDLKKLEAKICLDYSETEPAGGAVPIPPISENYKGNDIIEGFSCESSTDCNANQTCSKDGICVCNKSFMGTYCCPTSNNKPCSGNGVCSPDSTCICMPGWQQDSPDCSVKACPFGENGEECSGRTNGICNIDTGACQCYSGYALNAAGTCERICNPPCKGNSTCVNGACKCKDGWTGDTCGSKDCDPPCPSYQICNNGKCACRNGFEGDKCDIQNCYPACLNGGLCEIDALGKQKCKCPPNYTGPTCSQKQCPKGSNNKICSGRGVCNQAGTCLCEDGYDPPNCVKTCPKCLNGGRCNVEAGMCECITGFAGTDCGSKSDPVPGKSVAFCNTTDYSKLDTHSVDTSKRTILIRGGTQERRNALVSLSIANLDTNPNVLAFLNSANYSDNPISYKFTSLWECLAVYFTLRCGEDETTSPLCGNFMQTVINMEMAYNKNSITETHCPTLTTDNGLIYQQLRVIPPSAPGQPTNYGCWAKGDSCANDNDCHYSYGSAGCKAYGPSAIETDYSPNMNDALLWDKSSKIRRSENGGIRDGINNLCKYETTWGGWLDSEASTGCKCRNDEWFEGKKTDRFIYRTGNY